MTPLTKSIVIILSLMVNSGLASNNAKAALQEGTKHFDKGEYKKALLLLQTINIRRDLDNSDDMKLAFKIRAISFEQTGDAKHAQETIRELLFLDPDYQFNPFDTPPSVVALDQKENAIIEEKNKHMESIKSEAKALREMENADTAVPVEKQAFVIEKKPPMVTTLFPAGLNHFYLGSPIRGGVYLSLQTLGLGTNIAAFWWKQSYLQSTGKNFLKDQSNKGRFETAQMFQYIGLGALVIGYGASFIDAMIQWHNMPSQKVVLSVPTP